MGLRTRKERRRTGDTARWKYSINIKQTETRTVGLHRASRRTPRVVTSDGIR